jgi:tRNA G37 N-methylase TrmD
VFQPWNAQQSHIDDSFPVSVLSQVISCQPTNFTTKHSPQQMQTFPHESVNNQWRNMKSQCTMPSSPENALDMCEQESDDVVYHEKHSNTLQHQYSRYNKKNMEVLIV